MLANGLVFGVGDGFAHGNRREGLNDTGFGDFILDNVDAVHQDLHLLLLDVLQYLISILGFISYFKRTYNNRRINLDGTPNTTQGHF